MKFIISILSLFLVFPVFNNITGQVQSVSGLVLDIQTNKPLPFVNIIYNSKNQSITSDIDGKFYVKDLSRIEFLKFSFIGYAAKSINKEYLMKNPKITVFLVEETYDLSEVVVYPGENPAHRIIYKVLENRKLNNPEELSSYSYTSYNKMIFTADIDNAKKIVSDSTTFSDSLQIDTSLVRAKKFLDSQHLFLMESISERNYRKPGKIYEKVLASKVSGFKQPSFILLATQMQSFSFYDEMITLMDSRYVSPISSGSPNRYFFNIEDTTYTASGDTVFSISFKPRRNKKFEALKGVLNINTNKYAIQSVVAEPVENSGIVDLKITQNYSLIDGIYWFPVQLNTDMVFSKFVEAKAGDNNLKFIGIGKSYLNNIKINPDVSEIKFKAIELELNKDAFNANDSLWLQYRRDSLTTQENRTYQVIDSIGDKEKLDLKLKMFKTISKGYIPFHFIDINVLSLLDFNVFEGFRPGLGFRTNEKISKVISIGAYGAYGFKDEEWKYGGNLDFLISGPSQMKVGVNYENDVIESSGFLFFEDQLTFNSSEIYREFLVADMTYTEDLKFSFSLRAFKHFRFNLYGQQSILSNASPYIFKQNGEFDSPGQTYHTFETGIQLKYAPNEGLAYLAGELFSINPNHSPVLYLNLIRGIRMEKSDFDYLKIETKLNLNFMTKSFGKTSIQLVGGKVIGDLPYFLLYNGHESYYDFTVEAANSFATMRMNEFLSDEFVSFHLRQDFGGLIFKGKKFRPKFVVASSIGFGRLAKPELHQNINFKSMEKGYYESGILINNIIRQLNIIGYGFGVYYRYGPNSFSNISDNFAYKLSLTFEL